MIKGIIYNFYNLFFIKLILVIIYYFILFHISIMGIGDWGLGIGDGDWGLGPIPNPQSPIPNPQSPLKNFSILI